MTLLERLSDLQLTRGSKGHGLNYLVNTQFVFPILGAVFFTCYEEVWMVVYPMLT